MRDGAWMLPEKGDFAPPRMFFAGRVNITRCPFQLRFPDLIGSEEVRIETSSRIENFSGVPLDETNRGLQSPAIASHGRAVPHNQPAPDVGP